MRIYPYTYQAELIIVRTGKRRFWGDRCFAMLDCDAILVLVGWHKIEQVPIADINSITVLKKGKKWNLPVKSFATGVKFKAQRASCRENYKHLT